MHKTIPLISSAVVTLLVAGIGWVVSYVWESDNKVQQLLSYQSLLVTPSGDIRPSVKVERLDVRVTHLEDQIKECRP